MSVNIDMEPFSLDKTSKKEYLTRVLNELSKHHVSKCKEYRGMMQGLSFNGDAASYTDIPFLPVRLFKELDLKSLDSSEEVFKVMTSSGTTGQMVSKIYLDKETASLQQRVLARIMPSFTGSARMPMLIIDCPSVIKNRKLFTARGAAIIGFSMFGTDKAYALDDDMNLDVEGVLAFLEKHKGKRILCFGFTFMIWQHFYKELLKQKIQIDLSSGVLIHGGGWKKLLNEAVSSEVFKNSLYDICRIKNVHDYYGMVEQTGCIYLECEEGHFHASIFSDIITRRGNDFSICDIGEEGIVQVVSVIPRSYPGHSLLTEDLGTILGEDDCPCGRLGKYFKISGRLKNAEIRGCGDTYAAGL